jgi:hypothetical protein
MADCGPIRLRIGASSSDTSPNAIAKLAGVEALRLWFDRLASFGRIKHGLADAPIALLPDAGKRDGAIRPDLGAQEVLLLVGFRRRIDLDTDWERRSRA